MGTESVLCDAYGSDTEDLIKYASQCVPRPQQKTFHTENSHKQQNYKPNQNYILEILRIQTLCKKHTIWDNSLKTMQWISFKMNYFQRKEQPHCLRAIKFLRGGQQSRW